MQLSYKHDPHRFQIEAINAIQEILNARCSLMDYMLYGLMRAFDGWINGV